MPLEEAYNASPLAKAVRDARLGYCTSATYVVSKNEIPT